MTVRPLRVLGDPVLRTPCDRVVRFDDSVAQLVRDLLDTVQVHGRAGLAANQIGSSLAVFAYNIDGQLGYVINPVLTQASGEQVGQEACLSVPDVSAARSRPAYAVVVGVDLRQRPVTVAGGGEMARCLQHAITCAESSTSTSSLARSAATSCVRSAAGTSVNWPRV